MKAMVERTPWAVLPNASAAVGAPVDAMLDGLNGRVLETYDDTVLVEIDEKDKEKLKQRGRERSILVTLQETFDQILLNGRVLDARDGVDKVPPGDTPDGPYLRNEQGSWLIQFIGPIKDAWLDAVRAAGVVPVQRVPATPSSWPGASPR